MEQPAWNGFIVPMKVETHDATLTIAVRVTKPTESPPEPKGTDQQPPSVCRLIKCSFDSDFRAIFGCLRVKCQIMRSILSMIKSENQGIECL